MYKKDGLHVTLQSAISKVLFHSPSIFCLKCFSSIILMLQIQRSSALFSCRAESFFPCYSLILIKDHQAKYDGLDIYIYI